MTLAPLDRACAVHMAIDMQRVFTAPTVWRIADFDEIVPNVAAIAAAMRGRTIFTRFITPTHAEEAVGRWRHYYRCWPQFTAAELDPALIEIDDRLGPHVTAELVIDKPTYSVFEAPECTARLAALAADTIIFTGVETDVCVLASLLAAVDRGYRVVAVDDALTSSSAAGHRAALAAILPRMPDQIDIATTAAVLAALG